MPILSIQNNTKKKHRGFTLMELIIVIVLLGVIAVGVSGVIRLASQTFVNASERDEIASNARFVLERLNREIRNALPGSLLLFDNGRAECIQFTPIVASSHYLTIPLNPITSDFLTVVPFTNNDGTDYTCNNCGDSIIVNPLVNTDVYTNNLRDIGQNFLVNNINNVAPNGQWQLNLNRDVSFNRGSPAGKFYIINGWVQYCLVASRNQLFRITGMPVYDDENDNLPSLGNSARTVMADNVRAFNTNPPFVFDNPNLTRNGVVKVDLEFFREDTDDPNTQETVVFNHEIHIKNTP